MKTKQALYLILLVAGTSLMAFKTQAQSDSRKFHIGFGLEGGIPVGTYAKASYKADGGITLRFSYHAGPGFVTLTSGVIGYYPNAAAGKDVKASLQIPVKAGYKYVIYKPFFVMAEVGYSSFKSYYSDGYGDMVSGSTGAFTYAPTIGVTFKAFELGIKYESLHAHESTLSNIGLRLGFNF